MPINFIFDYHGDRCKHYQLFGAFHYKVVPPSNHYFATFRVNDADYFCFDDSVVTQLKVENGFVLGKGVRLVLYEETDQTFSDSISDCYPKYVTGNFKVEESEEQDFKLQIYSTTLGVENIEIDFSTNYFKVKIPEELDHALDNLSAHQLQDSRIKKIIDLYKNQNPKIMQEYLYHSDEKILYKRLDSLDPGDSQVVRVLPEELINPVIKHLHSFYGHPGANKLYSITKWYFYFNNQNREVRKFLAGCQDCKENKPKNLKIIPEHANVAPRCAPGAFITFDFYGPMPRGTGRVRYLLVARDCATGYIWVKGMKDAVAENAMELLDRVVKEVALYPDVAKMKFKKKKGGAIEFLKIKFLFQKYGTSAPSNAKIFKKIKIAVQKCENNCFRIKI